MNPRIDWTAKGKGVYRLDCGSRVWLVTRYRKAWVLTHAVSGQTQYQILVNTLARAQRYITNDLEAVTA
jgi:hypothetical protein